MMEEDDAVNYTILEEEIILKRRGISPSGDHFTTFTTA